MAAIFPQLAEDGTEDNYDISMEMITEKSIDMDFFTACALGAEDAVRSFLESDTERSSKNNSGWTGAHYAAKNGHAAMITLLGADSSTWMLADGTTPPMLASAGGHLSTLKEFHLTKDQIDATDETGRTPLFLAVEFGNLDIAKYLLEKNASANIKAGGMSPLTLAVENGHSSIVAMLLSSGADPCDDTALKSATSSGQEKIASLIMNAIADRENLQSLLIQLKLEKYWPNFRDNKINMEDLMTLKDDDLKAIGISRLGPRKKILNSIKTMKKGQKNNSQ